MKKHIGLDKVKKGEKRQIRTDFLEKNPKFLEKKSK